MKPPALLLAGSLAANAILVCVLLAKPELAPPAVRPFLGHSASTGAAPRSTPRAPRAAPAQKLWAVLGTDDLPTLIMRLRAAGFPASIIRQIVNLELNQRYDARLRAIYEPDASVPFWKMASSYSSVGGDGKRQAEYSAIQRERTKLQRELLSGDFFNSDDVSAGQRRQFGNLSRQKIDLLQRIEDDYAEMLSGVRAGMRGITLPEDRQQLEFLNNQKHADLAAILSPEELADYEMRSSPITRLLQNRFNNFTPTEAEFRAIFAMQQTLNDKFPYTSNSFNDYQQRQDSMKALNDQLRATIGNDRYRDFMRETSSDYQTLTRLAQRENLPVDTALRAYNLRDGVDQESNRIFDDASLSNEQKRAALQALAQTTRSQLVTLLGPTAGPAYVKQLDNQWLGQVERGTAIAFNGGGTGGMSISSDNVIVMLGSQPTYRRVPPPPRQ